MILYGRDLSPFVRRVAIWCALQGREVERRPLAATDPEESKEIAKVHPGVRVPALVLDDGAVLIETFAICDWLDESAPEGRRLVPERGLARRDCLQRLGLANATAEKCVAMVYERNRRPEEFHWPEWQRRVANQIQGGFAALEAAMPEAGFHGGEAMDGSDIAILCAWQFAEVTNPWLLTPGYPRLAAHAERAMEIPIVAETKPAA